MSDRSIYVLYGSQTGNAESIAKDMSTKLLSENIANKCMDLNVTKTLVLKELASCLIVVCSTTGNGDSPENANEWWRTVKLRCAAKDMFEGLPYFVLGLGDTNYDKFCYMGKQIDKRLGELGGKRAMDLVCADEGTGLEETIERWKAAALTLTRKIHQDSISQAKCAGEPVDEEKIGEEMRHLHLEDVSVGMGECTGTTPVSCNTTAESPSDYCTAQVDTEMPANILAPGQIATALGLTDALAVPPTAAQLPRAKPCPESKSPYRFTAAAGAGMNTPAGVSPVNIPCRDSATSLKTRSGSDHSLPEGGIWTVDNPFHATVAAARWLTSKPPGHGDVEWGSARRVVHMELSLTGSGINYAPGDSVGICCPNAPYAVDIVAQRLQAAHPEIPITLDTSITCTADGSQTTLQEILSYKYDLMGPPKKASLLTLAQCCTDPIEANMLQHLCSKSETGKKLWDKCVESQRVGFAELFALFPSCTPRLHQLIACLTTLPPRYYSISSSPLACHDRVSIAFSSVRYTCRAELPSEPATAPIKRSGLCTTYLENLLRPLLCRSAELTAPQFLASTEIEPKIRMFHKVSVHFHLPGSVAPPLILIGPGTGVAPFMGFLEHRQQLAMERRRSAGSEDCCMGMWRGGFELEEEDLPAECKGGVEEYIRSVEPGPVHLFFGCRNEHDFLFKRELQDYLCTRTLSELDVAMSRVGPEKVYVTHKLRARAGEIARLILEDSAHVYICGDGNQMAKDVYCTIKAILSAHTGLTDEETETMIQDMKLRRRYILDIWS